MCIYNIHMYMIICICVCVWFIMRNWLMPILGAKISHDLLSASWRPRKAAVRNFNPSPKA